MDDKLNEKEQEQPVAKKKDYMPPTLTVYGKLTELTGGGTRGTPEGQHSSSPNKQHS